MSIFQIEDPDYTLSPYTGMTRKHWLSAGRYLLEGIFQHIPDMDHPVVVPRKERKVTYPHLNVPEKQQEIERKAEIFEGLTRSFFIAGVMIKNEPDITIGTIRLKDYYKKHILRAFTEQDPFFIGKYSKLQEQFRKQDPFRTFQQTVETCALVIGLEACRKEIWETYTKEEKDLIANALLEFAHGNTVPQNWRLFNMLDMAFLYKEGYPIDEEIMSDHAQAILNETVGDGWYRDGQCFDYYSCWAFNVYAPIWNRWYGYEKEPYLARRFEECSNELMKTYPDFFDADGYTNMWGRSCIYRNAATSPLAANFFLKRPAADPGRARRIASGSLLQFLLRDDFLYQGIPTLGFYGQFTPLVQGYSCAESPFWLGKAFLSLELPEDHPFWTATEHNGDWDTMQAGEVKETLLSGPALCFTNHQANKETILRTGKVSKTKEDLHGMWNYSKLCYNSKYPWEATPVDRETGRTELCESQQYLLFEDCIQAKNPARANMTFWCGERKGILYRRQFFHFELETEQHWIQGMNLADFPVARGMMRVDKLHLFRQPVRLTLGSYGFPDNLDESGNGTRVLRQEETLPDGSAAKAVILIGHDHMGREKQMAMTCYCGFESMELIRSRGTNPESEDSIVIYATVKSQKQYGGAQQYLLISQVLTAEPENAKGECVFSKEELFPIREILYEDRYQVGAYGTTRLCMKNGTEKEINFEGTESAF